MKQGSNQLMIKNISIVYILLALVALDLWLYGIAIFFPSFIVFLFIKYKTLLKISLDAWLLYAFGGLYLVFTALSSVERSIGEFLRGFVPMMAFFIGFNLNEKKDFSCITKVIYILSVFMALHGILNLLYNFTRLGTGVLGNMTALNDIWSGTTASATGQASNFCLLTGILYYSMIVQHDVKVRMGISFLFVLAFVYNLALGGRSFLILTLLAIVSGFLVHLYCSLGKKIHIKNILPTLILIGFFVIGAYYAYQNNIAGIGDIVEDSFWYQRFFSLSGQDITEDSRLDRKIQYYNLFFTYMFGGNHINIAHGVGFAHELWLDIFDAAGIIPFILIWIYTLRAWHRVLMLLSRKEVEAKYKILVVSLSMVVSIYFFIEPILYGTPILLLSFCIIDGMVASYLS